VRVVHLSLTNFRNYARLETDLPAGILLLHGANAQGKTSLLESIYYLATAHSPWASSDRQLLNWTTEGDPLAFTRIDAQISRQARAALPGTQADATIDLTLAREQLDPESRLKKTIRVNGVPRRALDLLGTANVVLFVPQDLALVEGSPSVRRHYLNMTLSQADQEYAQALHRYEKALEQRNALLRRIQERQASPRELDFWDTQLTTAGAIVISGRQRLLADLEYSAQRVHRELTHGAETLDLRYQPAFVPDVPVGAQMAFSVPGLDLSRPLTHEQIAGQFADRLKARRSEEIMRGITLLGPQRDELRFCVNGRDLGIYGSRGQARTAVLAIKLAELDWVRRTIGDWPILLLDEVLAELDAERRAYLLAQIDGAAQAIVTATEPDRFTASFLSKAAQWHIRAGQITPQTGNSAIVDTNIAD